MKRNNNQSGRINGPAAGRIAVPAILAIAVAGGVTYAVVHDGGGKEQAAATAAAPSAQPAQGPGSQAAQGAWQVVRAEGDTLELKLGADTLRLDAISTGAVRVQVNPGGKADPDTEVVARQEFPAAGAKLDAKSNPVTLSTGKLKVTFDKATGRLDFYDQSGKRLLTQTQVLDAVQNKLQFQNGADDRLYGLTGYDASSTSTDGMLRTGTKRVRGGQQGNAGAPLVWSTAGYGVLVDTIDTRFDREKASFTFSETSKKSAQYFLLAGRPADILAGVADISGKPPMFPKWAIGFNNSEWGIDQKELEGIVATYRQKQIPLDHFTLDFDWKAWSEDQYGEFRWNTAKFPDGPSGKLKAEMDAQGVKLTGIFKPRLHVDTEQGRYATEHQFWWPKKANYADYFSHKTVNDLNFTLPEVRKWYWEHTKPAFDTGIIGYWNDEADEGYPTLQFLDMQKGLYEGQRSYKDQRVWSINRNFYLGAQKYAYGLWSGDIKSGFQTMADQRQRMLSAVNLGQMKWGMDTGGFTMNPQPDNYARWMQFSAFTPLFRVHAKENMQRQPWSFGPKAEAAATAAIRLRYELIPYIYSYERQALDTGIGLVKPLVWEYPEDALVENLVDSWMFGDALLVSPIVSDKEQVKSIYLPKGEWIDYWTGQTYVGGQTIAHQVDLENWSDLPLFIKKGSILAKQPVQNYIGEKPVETVTLDVFPNGQESGFTFYEDDGASYQYEKGAFFKQRLTAVEQGGQVVFKASKPEGTYTPEAQTYLVRIHGRSGTKVSVDGEALPQVFDEKSLAAGSKEGYAVGKGTYGDVTIVRLSAGQAKQVTVQ